MGGRGMPRDDIPAPRSADYFILRKDTIRGPTTSARIRELAAACKLSADDLIRRGDDGDWFRAGDLAGLFDGNGADGELITDPLLNLTKTAGGVIARTTVSGTG